MHFRQKTKTRLNPKIAAKINTAVAPARQSPVGPARLGRESTGVGRRYRHIVQG